MKKIAAVVLATLFVASTLPAFAVEQPAKERNLFKIIESTLKPGEGKAKNKLRDPFQKMDCAKAVSKASCAEKTK